MMAPELMMIFVGTEHTRGKQFHVWVNQHGTSEDLIEAISHHETLPPSSFILQHSPSSSPIIPFQPLLSQSITPYSTVHLFHIEDLRRREIQRKSAQKVEYERRGRYESKKDGKMKLRRRSKKDLQEHRRREKRRERGEGIVPCFKVFCTEVHPSDDGREDREEGKLDYLSAPMASSGLDMDMGVELDRGSTAVETLRHPLRQRMIRNEDDRKKRAKDLLTSRPLHLDSSSPDKWISSSTNSPSHKTIPSSSASSSKLPLRSYPTTRDVSLRSNDSESAYAASSPSPSPKYGRESGSNVSEPDSTCYAGTTSPRLPQCQEEMNGPVRGRYWEKR
ncbi:hypothetical protein I302_103789 [Kwoniella bestiolae CBS 10118]|uniref:Uncharacterized protein n=1 Tax=Kwoniella bestiolae CBS 10118 TaxID=1296100 RepID=A0A1B9G9F9_9TREE|nr:hypothetical protein I302_02493 [Kwoniella bestiolae CBS 10118]OCF27649.1 hypothetical protein I302_02493 [Kwoniella bestiolae CBS 10118]